MKMNGREKGGERKKRDASESKCILLRNKEGNVRNNYEREREVGRTCAQFQLIMLANPIQTYTQ